MSVERIKLTAIRTDGGTQMRAAIASETVEEYAESYRAGTTMPPVVVFYDGKDYWLGDGFHRVEAQRRLTFVDVGADVRAGTKRDAILYAIDANDANGLRLKLADRLRSADVLLRDPEWSKWSDRQIGKKCGLHHETVGKRRELSGDSARCDEPTRPRKVVRNGRVYEQKTAAIGKTQQKSAVAATSTGATAPRPSASERTVSMAAIVPAENMFAVTSDTSTTRSANSAARSEPVACPLDDMDDVAPDDDEMNEPDEAPDDDRVVYAPGWRPPAESGLDGLDVDLAAAPLAQLCKRFVADIRAAHAGLPSPVKDRATRRVRDHLLAVVAAVTEIAPHLRGEETTKPTLRVVK
jgi:hypothetical protein